jgi:hypothetical protein
MLKRLKTHRINNKVHSYWTQMVPSLRRRAKSAYVIKIEINTRLIFTDFEDNRVSINGLDNVTITVSWNPQKSNFMDQLIPMISQKVIESINPTLKKMVDDIGAGMVICYLD